MIGNCYRCYYYKRDCDILRATQFLSSVYLPKFSCSRYMANDLQQRSRDSMVKEMLDLYERYWKTEISFLCSGDVPLDEARRIIKKQRHRMNRIKKRIDLITDRCLSSQEDLGED